MTELTCARPDAIKTSVNVFLHTSDEAAQVW